MTRTFKTWFGSFAITAVFVWVCFQWFDKPIALWIYHICGGRHIPTELADRILSFRLYQQSCSSYAVSSLLWGAHFRSARRRLRCAPSVPWRLSSSRTSSNLPSAGRGPTAWGPGIVSFVRDNVYGFHFFQSGKSFESFPSGHAAVAAAVLSVAWILFPNLTDHLHDRRDRRRYRPRGSQSSFSQ